MVWAKNFFYIVSCISGLTAIADRITSRTVKILMYHGICDDDEPVKCWWQLSKTKFEQQIQYLRRTKNILSLNQICEIFNTEKDVPPNSVVITFDDGYRNYLTNALPILKKMGVPSIIYIPTGPVSNSTLIWSDEIYYDFFNLSNTVLDLSSAGMGHWPFHSKWHKAQSIECCINLLKEMPDDMRSDKLNEIYDLLNLKIGLLSSENSLFELMTVDQIKEIAGEPLVEVGSHAVTHKPLTSISQIQAIQELRNSKDYLEAITNQNIHHFCYPAGYYNQDIVDAVSEAGYKSAVVVGESYKKIKDTYHLPRIGIGSTETTSFFKCQVCGLVTLKDKIKYQFKKADL